MTSTFEINALPKVDKNQFITSFIQSQKPHAKAYAEEGLSAFANDPPNKENQFGFSSTPLLKARNPKHDVQETAESQPSVKFKPSEGRKQLSSVRTKTFVKKRSTNEGSDNEDQVARLAERRERKRAKRMVVKAAATVEPSVCSETVKNGRSKNQKKEKESGRTTAKVPPALALMHGFSATNVGNKRLTAPPPVIGVFNKGKASNKTLVSNNKASTRNVMQSFSEEIFLNKTSDPKRFKAETHDDSTSENALELSKSKIHVSDNGPQVDSSSTIESLREDPHTDTLPPQISNKDADGSNIWDIERDSFVLPSSAPDLPPSPRLERQSIVLDIRDLPWSTSVPMQAHENNSPFCSDPLSSIPSNAQRCTKSSSSLAPSQSASQCGFAHRRTVDKPVVITSKYFTQKAGEIVCDTDRSLSPPIKDPRKDPPSLICPYDIQQELEEEEPLVTDTFREANICPLDHCLGSDEDQAQAVPMLSERERRDAFRDQEGRTFPGTFLETEDVPNNLTDACQYQEDPVYTTALDGHQDENYTIPASSFLPYAPSSEIDYSFEQSWHVLPLWSVEHPPEEPFLASDAEYVPDEDADQWESDMHSIPIEESLPDVILTSDAEYWGLEDASYTNRLDEDYEMDYANDDYAFSDQAASYFQEDLEWLVEPVRPASASELAVSMSEIYIEDCENEGSGPHDFLQGRELLLGLSGSVGGRRPVSSAEADVARSLKGHWLPQRL